MGEELRVDDDKSSEDVVKHVGRMGVARMASGGVEKRKRRVGILLGFEELQKSLRRERFGEVDHGGDAFWLIVTACSSKPPVTHFLLCEVMLFSDFEIGLKLKFGDEITILIINIAYICLYLQTYKTFFFLGHIF